MRWMSIELGIAAGLLLTSASCAPQLVRKSLLGQIPEVTTTAEPEWLPFAIRAGARAEVDPRETHLQELRAMTEDGDVTRVAWSPDSRSVALEERRPGDAHSQIYVMDLGTGSTTRASQPDVEASSPTFSWPDGSRVIFSEESNGKSRVVSVATDAKSTRELMVDARDPAMLADGSALLFVHGDGSARDLFIEGLSGGASQHRLLSDPARDELAPVTSLDRTRVAWIAKKKPASFLMTARVADPPAEARGVEALSTDAESVRSAGFLADSHRLAFSSDRDDPSYQIYVVDLDERFGPGAPPRSLRVTFAEGGSEAPAFSPDGRHVAFVSRRAALGIGGTASGKRPSTARRLFIARWVDEP